MTTCWSPCLATWPPNYVQMRTLEGRIECADANVKLQRETLTITEARFRGGTTSELDVYQARSTLGANRGPDSRVGDQSAANGQPTLHLAGHAAGRVAGQARSGADSHRAARRGRRHSGRLAAPPARRSPCRTSGGRPKRADRRRRGRLLSGHLDQRNARLLGQQFPDLFRSVGAQWQRRPFLSVEPLELRADPEQRPLPGRQVPGIGVRPTSRRC